jgi:hypothetical protein
MKDTKLLIEKYEELRDICIDLYDIADRHPELKHVHDSLIEVADALIKKAHVLFTEAYELKRDEENEK